MSKNPADTRNTWENRFRDEDIHERSRDRGLYVGYDIPTTEDPLAHRSEVIHDPRQAFDDVTGDPVEPFFPQRTAVSEPMFDTQGNPKLDGGVVQYSDPRIVNTPGRDGYDPGLADYTPTPRLESLAGRPVHRVERTTPEEYAAVLVDGTTARVQRIDSDPPTYIIAGSNHENVNIQEESRPIDDFPILDDVVYRPQGNPIPDGDHITRSAYSGNRSSEEKVAGDQSVTTKVDGKRQTNTLVSTNVAASAFGIDNRNNVTGLKADFSVRGLHYDARATGIQSNEQITAQRSTTDVSFIRRVVSRYHTLYQEVRASFQIRHSIGKRFVNRIEPGLISAREASLKINQDTNCSTRRTSRWYIWGLYQRHAGHIEITAGPIKPDRKTHSERFAYKRKIYSGPAQIPHVHNLWSTLTEMAQKSLNYDKNDNKGTVTDLRQGMFSPIGEIAKRSSKSYHGGEVQDTDDARTFRMHRQFDKDGKYHNDSLAHISDQDPESTWGGRDGKLKKVISGSNLTIDAVRNFLDFAERSSGADPKPGINRFGTKDEEIAKFAAVENRCNSPYDIGNTLGQRFEYIRRRMSANRDIPAQRGRGEFSGGLQLKHTVIPDEKRRKFKINETSGTIEELTPLLFETPPECNTALALRYRHPYDYLRDASMDHQTGDSLNADLKAVKARSDIPMDRDHRRHYINQKRKYILPEAFWDVGKPLDRGHWKKPILGWSDKRRMTAASTEIVLDMDNGRWLTPASYQENSRIIIAVTKPRAEKSDEDTLSSRKKDNDDPSLMANKMKYSFVEVNGAGVAMTKLPRLGYQEQGAREYNPYANPDSPTVEGVPANVVPDERGMVGVDKIFHAEARALPEGSWLSGLTHQQAYSKNKIKLIKADDEHGIRLRVAQPSEPVPVGDPTLSEATLAGAEGIHPNQVEQLKGYNTGATLNLANNHASMHFNHAAIVLDDNNALDDNQEANARIKLVSYSNKANSQKQLSELSPADGSETTFIELKGNKEIVAKCGAAIFKLTPEGIEMRFGDHFLNINGEGISQSFSVDTEEGGGGPTNQVLYRPEKRDRRE